MIVKETKNTHEKVRDFQNRLYLTAKTSKKRRFHAMYDKIYRKDILEEAWKRVKTNGGWTMLNTKAETARQNEMCSAWNQVAKANKGGVR